MPLCGRSLHWVFKISNLKKTLEILEKTIGMHVLRHEEFNSGCEASCNGDYARPWSKTMVGFGQEDNHFVLELTFNYGIKRYEAGNDFRYVRVAANTAANGDIRARAAQHNVPIDPTNDTITLPDGYKIKLVDVASPDLKDACLGVSLNVESLAKAKDFYQNVLGLQEVSSGEGRVALSYDAAQASVEFIEIGEPIEHSKAYGRIAFSIESIDPVVAAVTASGDTIHTAPVALPTEGKATVHVVILADRDNYEICFVGDEGFRELSQLKEGDERIDWAQRRENGSRDPE